MCDILDFLYKDILKKEIAEQKKRKIIIEKINSQDKENYVNKIKEELNKYNEK